MDGMSVTPTDATWPTIQVPTKDDPAQLGVRGLMVLARQLADGLGALAEREPQHCTALRLSRAVALSLVDMLKPLT